MFLISSILKVEPVLYDNPEVMFKCLSFFHICLDLCYYLMFCSSIRGLKFVCAPKLAKCGFILTASLFVVYLTLPHHIQCRSE